jgi:hypothetical protein
MERILVVEGRPGQLRVTGDFTGVEIHDAFGRAVRFLRSAPPNRLARWDGRDERGRPVPPGLYFIRFSGPRGAVTRPLVLD